MIETSELAQIAQNYLDAQMLIRERKFVDGGWTKFADAEQALVAALRLAVAASKARVP
jgi:hypothetical protein